MPLQIYLHKALITLIFIVRQHGYSRLDEVKTRISALREFVGVYFYVIMLLLW